jgi:hypothetical protein
MADTDPATGAAPAPDATTEATTEAATEAPTKPTHETASVPPVPAEAVLGEDLATGDLKGKVDEAWQDFATALANALNQLPIGASLDLTLDPTAAGTGDAIYAIRLVIGEQRELGGIAVGNAVLPEGFRLDRAAIAALVAMGWSPPGVVEGSGEHFGARLADGNARQLAILTTRTLRDIYGSPHPAFVMYQAHDGQGGALPVTQLGTARHDAQAELAAQAEGVDTGDLLAAEPAGALVQFSRDDLPLVDKVKTVVSALLKTPPDELPIDSDGDIGIRSGSAMVFVRVRDNPPLVDVFSPVLTDIQPSEKLYGKLSELTNRMPIGRLYCTNDTVWASVPVFGRDFQASHLMLAVQVMTGLADELDDRLHGEFGGKRFFGEGDKSAGDKGDESERTGMYL